MFRKEVGRQSLVLYKACEPALYVTQVKFLTCLTAGSKLVKKCKPSFKVKTKENHLMPFGLDF